MLVCRSRPRRFAAFSFFGTSSSASSDTSAAATAPVVPTASTSRQTDEPQESIFTAPESPWDHVFADLEPVPAPTQRRRMRLASKNDDDGDSLSHANTSAHDPGLVQRSSSGARRQRASLTAREMSVFDEMFDMIFDAMSTRNKGASGTGPTATSASTWSSSSVRRSTPDSLAGALSPGVVETPSIGRTAARAGAGGGAQAPLNDLFRTLRRQTSRVRWTTAIDEELDRKKETMELFNTDHALLRWVTTELFGEAERWEAEASKAIAAASDKWKGDGKGVSSKDGLTVSSTSSSSPPSSSSSLSSVKAPSDNYSIYPHLIAHAMRIFRTTYLNPSLSLAIFNHAARMSIPSYVFGCTAPVYNELIEARWEGWGDLEGVCNALEEMRANGIKMDGRTRIVAEKVRREVSAARPAEDVHAALEDGVNPFARRVWVERGEAEAMGLLHRIERLVVRDRRRSLRGKATSSAHQESWKSAILESGEDDGWRFDGWDEERKVARGSDEARTVLDAAFRS